MYDFKFSIKGPTSALGKWNKWPLEERFTDSNNNGIYDEDEEFVDIGNGEWDAGLDVAIVYSDDESYNLLSDKFSYPYPRSKIWGKAIENIASLGAKVIVLDYMFDAPDLSTTRSKIARDDLLQGKYSEIELEKIFPIQDSDQLLADAIIAVNNKLMITVNFGAGPGTTQS